MTDNPLESLLFDEHDILERVDEYSLYCRYLGYQPMIGAKYRSPLRPNDTDPSFGLYIRKFGIGWHEYLWKDQGIGLHGTIFQLVEYLYGLNTLQARQQICADFGLGGVQYNRRKVVEHTPKFIDSIHIEVVSKKFTSKEHSYWQQYNVNTTLLNLYNVSSVAAYYMVRNQFVPSFPKGMGFAYRIWNKYQLYFPLAVKEKKFRNDWTETCVPGFQQLQYNSPLLIITKSYKDVACLRSLGYEAIAPRGENILLPGQCINYIQQKYSRIVTLFDNDGKHKAIEYPFKELHVPLSSGEKDPTDFCARYGPNQTAEMLSVILNS